MSTTVISGPLKLENQCLLHLICHLEDYLPETLALLPLHLRRRLLLNLPVADVCQLENTAVSSGIDMEDSIWSVLCVKCLPKFVDIDRPKHLMNVIVHALTSPHYCDLTVRQKAKAMLFCANWKGVQQGCPPIGTRECRGRYSIPNRYLKYFHVGYPELDLMSFLVHKCQWMPAQLQIDSREFELSQLWRKRNTCRCRYIMKQYLSRVQELSSIHPIDQNVYMFVLKEIMNNRQTTLRRLKFQIDEHSANFLTCVAQLFSPSSSGGGRHPSIPYSKLSSIAVDAHGCCIPKSTDPLLQSMISYQKTLSSVELFTDSKVLSMHQISFSLVSVLGSLFHQPQFRELSLGNVGMHQTQLNALLPPFLSAPSGQALKLINVYVLAYRTRAPAEDMGSKPTHEGMSFSRSGNSSCGVSRLPRKALTLKSSKDGMPVNGLWLSAFNCSSLLSSLTVEGTDSPKSVFSLCCPNHRTTMLQHLRLHSVTFHLQPSPDLLLTNLFQGPHLKTVHLINCDIGKDGLLPALTQGLRRQITVGSLEDLSLEKNSLGTLSDRELQEFFDMLFSLPQLSNLQVNLKFNLLKPSHLSLMHKSWESKAGQPGRKLKALMVLEDLCIKRFEFVKATLLGQMLL